MVAYLGNVNNLADKYNSEEWALVPSNPFVDAQKQCVDAELASTNVNDMSIDAANALYVTPQGRKGSSRISPELRGDLAQCSNGRKKQKRMNDYFESDVLWSDSSRISALTAG